MALKGSRYTISRSPVTAYRQRGFEDGYEGRPSQGRVIAESVGEKEADAYRGGHVVGRREKERGATH